MAMAGTRPGTQGATELLRAAPGAWQSMLRNYDEAVRRVAESKKKPDLVALDQWLWKEFPLAVGERSPPHCTKEELARIMQWKLLRGKNRPALLNLINQNEESAVRAVSQEAFRLLFSSKEGPITGWKSSLIKLTELRGVGPATASAILAPLDTTSSIPFMADETLEAVTNQKREYTLRVYECMHQALQEVCVGQLGGQMRPEQAGKALWTAAMLSIHPPSNKVTKDKKNSRDSKLKEDDRNTNGTDKVDFMKSRRVSLLKAEDGLSEEGREERAARRSKRAKLTPNSSTDASVGK